MNMTSEITVNIKSEELNKKVAEASKQAMRDTVVEVTNDAVKESPWITGNNRRMLVGEVSGMGVVATEEGQCERLVDDSQIEGAVYSTSGYGGYLEVGTSKMPPQPYIKPAMDQHFTAENYGEKVRRYLE